MLLEPSKLVSTYLLAQISTWRIAFFTPKNFAWPTVQYIASGFLQGGLVLNIIDGITIGSGTRVPSGTVRVGMFKGNLIMTLQANDQTKLKAQDRRGSTCPCQMVSFSPRLANGPRWPRRRSGIWQNLMDSSSLQFKNLKGDKNIDHTHIQ